MGQASPTNSKSKSFRRPPLLEPAAASGTRALARLLVSSSAVGIAVTVLLARTGWLMAPIQPMLLGVVALVAVVYFFGLDWVKVWLFRRLQLR